MFIPKNIAHKHIWPHGFFLHITIWPYGRNSGDSFLISFSSLVFKVVYRVGTNLSFCNSSSTSHGNFVSVFIQFETKSQLSIEIDSINNKSPIKQSLLLLLFIYILKN